LHFGKYSGSAPRWCGNDAPWPQQIALPLLSYWNFPLNAMLYSVYIVAAVVVSFVDVFVFSFDVVIWLCLSLFFNSSVEVNTVLCKYVDLYYLLLTDLSEK
jgi:hypothetical protein